MGYILFDKNGWNLWWRTGMDQIMIQLRDISFDLAVLFYMKPFASLVVNMTLRYIYLH